MNIGKAAKASKVSAKMIRYYEQIGLIPAASRTDSGYRAYTQADVNQLHFIRRARDLGFSVAEISDLLNLWNNQSRQSADVKRLAQTHIDELDRRIQNMQHMAQTLKALIHCCAGDALPDCPILHTLGQPDDSEPEARTGAVLRRPRRHGLAKRLSPEITLDLPTLARPRLATVPTQKEFTMQFHIDDMTCGGCASTVKKTILTLDANATVRTDPATRLVDVETSLSAEQIAAALQKAGFPPRER